LPSAGGLASVDSKYRFALTYTQGIAGETER
jgi:hypothetical protein